MPWHRIQYIEENLSIEEPVARGGSSHGILSIALVGDDGKKDEFVCTEKAFLEKKREARKTDWSISRCTRWYDGQPQITSVGCI